MSLAPKLPLSTPNTPNVLPTTHNQFSTVDIRDYQTTPHSHRNIVGENVNVVGHDQINNVTNITINPNLSAEENILSDPLFKKLPNVVKASYDASTPALRRACTENTRTTILNAIEEWAFDFTKPMIYWMNGMAGTGKTTISYSVSLLLKRHNILGATFFCSRLVDECTKVDRIFPTIAHHLSRNYHSLASTILEVIKHDPDVANRTINQQFTDLLVKPTRGAANGLAGRPIIVVIDGLDECVNQADVQTFLSVIFQRSSELPFKIFITSRPEQVVRVGFNRQDPNNYLKFILHDIERDLVNADIKLYVAERLVEMVDGRSDFQESSDDWPPEEKVDTLAQRSNRLFIYARTICDYIGEHGGNISERLDTAALSRKGVDEPSGDMLDTGELDRLYRDILDRAIPSRQKERDRLRLILAVIVSIRDPLSARGLGILLDINPGAIKSSLASLHSVISVPQSLDDPISTFHASFPDCIGDPTRSHHHFLSPSQVHPQLAKSCLSLMNYSLKENICDLQGHLSNDDIANDVVGIHISEGLAYACVYWAFHLTAARKEEFQDADDVCEPLNEFLREHVLHWMECLSLLKQLKVAIESLRMIGWILDIYPETFAMVTDALRFVMDNFEVCFHYPLETYHSALVWLTPQSIIRNRYASRKPDLPKVVVGLRNSWGSCEKAINCGSTVFSAAFSRDGSRVVSGTYDPAVRIWDAETGESEGLLEGHSSSVQAVAFCSDSGRIVSGSSDATVRIWNAVTGQSERTLIGHSDRVSSVAISSNGNHIVSGSYDKTVRMWNAITGKSEGVLEGYSDPVNSVAFSSDGSHVVIVSNDKIHVWNVMAVESGHILVEHSGRVYSAVFSSDGVHIVSGSDDTTVRIWCAVTGDLEGVFEGHSGPVHCVAFSNDGSRVVSGSYDRTIQIWDVATGKSEHSLEGHTSTVLSVAFSSDGSRIVSASSDKTVRIWNAVVGESEDIPERHWNSVSSIAFSSDGSHIASGSSDKTVRIWNAATGESEAVLCGHSDLVSSVAFSGNGSRVLSGSSDTTVSVWNAVTGEEERVLTGHSSPVLSVAFSNDGTRIVSGSHDKTIRIWDAVTGKSVHVLSGHSDWVFSVAFSIDGRHIVSGSGDRTARIWNTVTGNTERVLEGHSSSVLSVAFSNGGSYIVSGSSDKTVRIWDALTGESEGILEQHSYWVSPAASSSNELVAGLCDATRLSYVRLSDQTEIQYLPNGNFDLSTGHPRIFCFLSDDKTWIKTNSADCWIPQRYRRFYRTLSCGSQICFGSVSGYVVVLDFTGT